MRRTARTSGPCTLLRRRHLLTSSHRAASAGRDAVIRVLLSPPPRKDGTPHPKTRVKCVSAMLVP